MTITETCSCSASIAVPVESASYYARATSIVEEWRKGHRHEFPPADPMPDELPLIHESMSSHERLGDEYPMQDRALIGFTRNEVR